MMKNSNLSPAQIRCHRERKSKLSLLVAELAASGTVVSTFTEAVQSSLEQSREMGREISGDYGIYTPFFHLAELPVDFKVVSGAFFAVTVGAIASACRQKYLKRKELNTIAD
jgi:hypothetical protein